MTSGIRARRRALVVLSLLTAVVWAALAPSSSAVTPLADVSITMSDSPDPATAGDDVTYTLRVANGGPDAASNVVVTDVLPDQATFVLASPPCTQSGGTVTCSLGTMASGSVVTLDIVVRPTGNGTIRNTAQVRSDTTDPDPNDNTAVQDTGIRQIGTRLLARALLLEVGPTVNVRIGTAEATLTRADTAAPIAGELVVFNAGSTELCRALTDASGIARCSMGLPNVIIATVSLGYTARFNGSARYEGSTDYAPPIKVSGVIG